MFYFAQFRKTCFSLSLSVILSLALGVPPLASAEEESAPAPELDLEHLTPPPEPPSTEMAKESPKFVPGQLIVKLKPEASLNDLEPLNQQFGVTATDPVFPKAADPKDHLATLKQKLSTLAPGHEGWHWYADKDSREAKDYDARIAKEREELQQQIQAQEELVERLNQRQARAPKGAVAPALDATYLLKAQKSSDIPALVKAYAKHPAVEYAEPDYVATIQMVPNDPYVPYSSKLLQGVHQIDAPLAWDLSKGRGVVVAVIDTGADYRHEDLAANVWRNAGEIPGNGKDDDRDGFVDDVRGWDFVDNDSDPLDDNGHGTHVAGIIAAVGGNGKGIAGVAYEATVLPVRGLGQDGHGDHAQLAAALRYAADRGADVINNSWGGPGSQTLAAAIQYAHEQGCVLIAAAGNSDEDASTTYPAAYPQVIAVAAMSEAPVSHLKAPFSNYGPAVDLAAPGSMILSLRSAQLEPGAVVTQIGGVNIDYEKYMFLSGTSMAAPHVAGVAALLLAKEPMLSRDAVRIRLLTSATPHFEDFWSPGVLGAGIVNASRALRGDARPFFRIAAINVVNEQGEAVATSDATLKLTVTLENVGVAARQVRCSLLAFGTAIRAVPVSTATIGPIDARAFGRNTTPLQLTVGTVSPGAAAMLQLSIAADGMTQNVALTMPLGFGRLAPGTAVSGPSVSHGKIVWADRRNPDPRTQRLQGDIYLYDRATRQTVRLTSDPQDERDPVIAQSAVAWVYDNPWPRPFPFVAYGTVTGTALSSVTTQSAVASRLAISGRRIVWEDHRRLAPNGIDTIPSVYSLELGAAGGPRAQQVSPSAYDQEAPHISGSRIVWVDWRRHGVENSPASDIYLYDASAPEGQRERCLTTRTTFVSNPVIDEDVVVWEEGTRGYKDLVIRDLKAGTETVIASPNDQAEPSVSGNFVVWRDERRWMGDLYLYNRETKQETRLTSGFHHGNSHPVIHGNLITWRRGDNICFMEIETTPPKVTVLAPNGREQVEVDSTVQLRWRVEYGGTLSQPLPTRLVLMRAGFPDRVLTDQTTSRVGENAYAWTLPWPTQIPIAGGYRLRVEVTSPDQGRGAVPITDLSDAPFEIVIPPRPDLTIYQFTPRSSFESLIPPAPGTPWTVRPGTSLTLSYGCFNAGNTAAGPYTLTVSVNGREFYRSRPPHGLPPGHVREGSIPIAWRPEEGTHTVVATVNGDRAIRELDMTNNQSSFQVVVQPPPPELVARGISFYPNLPTNAQGQYVTTAGSPISLSFMVDNIGGGDAGRCSIAVTLDGQPYHQGSVSSVAKQTTSVYGMSGITTLTAGVHTLTFSVNADRRVPERDYTNNTKSVQILVQSSSRGANRPPEILYAGAFRWWRYLYAYTFARDPEDGYIYNWNQYRWSLSTGAQSSGWYFFQWFTGRTPVHATVTVTDRQGASAQRSVTAY